MGVYQALLYNECNCSVQLDQQWRYPSVGWKDPRQRAHLLTGWTLEEKVMKPPVVNPNAVWVVSWQKSHMLCVWTVEAGKNSGRKNTRMLCDSQCIFVLLVS